MAEQNSSEFEAPHLADAYADFPSGCTVEHQRAGSMAKLREAAAHECSSDHQLHPFATETDFDPQCSFLIAAGKSATPASQSADERDTEEAGQTPAALTFDGSASSPRHISSASAGMVPVARSPVHWRDTHQLLRRKTLESLGDQVMQSTCTLDGDDSFWRQLVTSAWSECTYNLSVGLLTFLYELFPTVISGPLCCIIEGVQSARNRGLLPNRSPHPMNQPLALDMCFLVWPWVMLLVYLAGSPSDVPMPVIGFPCLLLVWRAAVIGTKYASMSVTDINTVRRSQHWRLGMHNFRNLAHHNQFNTVGTLGFDIMQQLFLSALRNDLLVDGRSASLRIPLQAADHIIDTVCSVIMSCRDGDAVNRAALFPGGGRFVHDHVHMTYGNIQAALGLADLESVERLSKEGRVPIFVFALFLVLQGYRKTPVAYFFITGGVGFCFGVVHPIALVASGQLAFGTTIVAHVLYAIRVWAIAMGAFPIMLNLIAPVLDALKRLRLSRCLLVAFGDAELSASSTCGGLVDTVFDIPVHVDTSNFKIDDLRAYWILVRVCGPNLYRGLSLRYGSAYLLITITVLFFGTCFLYIFLLRGNELPLGVALELAGLFLLGAASTVITTLFGTMANLHVTRFVRVALRVAIRSSDGETTDYASLVIKDLETEYSMHPIMVAGIPASWGALSFIWSCVTSLVAAFLFSLRMASEGEYNLF